MAKGVKNAAVKLELAVKETDKAVLPRANNTNIFDTFPPGQHETMIIPRAIEGDGSNV